MLILNHDISIREAEENDFGYMVDYFLNADNPFLKGMGADPAKLPNREAWLTLLLDDHKKAVENKSFCYLIWLFRKPASRSFQH